MIARTKKIMAAGMAALTLGVTVAATSTPASAQGWGWGFGAGLLGGAAIGALAARPYYPYYGPGYYGGYGPGYGPAYGPGYGPAYYSGCYWRRRPVYGPYGDFAGYRRVRVCY